MPACPRRAIARFTDCLASDDSKATARRTGFVTRTSQMTGTLFLTLVTLGMGSDAKTTWAQWAAKVPPVGEHVAVAPEAMCHRMHQQALAFLQEMIRPPRAKGPSLAMGCEEKLLPSCATVSLADRTGVGWPGSRKATFPGSGGSAATAGATMQAVWDSTSSVLRPCVLTPWNIPDNTEGDTVGA